MIENYEQKKQQLLLSQGSHCPVCNKRFIMSDVIELAHRLRKDKPHIRMFGLDVIDHVLNLAATHKNCNSAVLINRACDPIQANEKVVDILSSILLDDPVIFKYKALMKAFDNIDKTKVVNIVSVGQLELLENFFAHYREM